MTELQRRCATTSALASTVVQITAIFKSLVQDAHRVSALMQRDLRISDLIDITRARSFYVHRRHPRDFQRSIDRSTILQQQELRSRLRAKGMETSAVGRGLQGRIDVIESYRCAARGAIQSSCIEFVFNVLEAPPRDDTVYIHVRGRA